MGHRASLRKHYKIHAFDEATGEAYATTFVACTMFPLLKQVEASSIIKTSLDEEKEETKRFLDRIDMDSVFDDTEVMEQSEEQSESEVCTQLDSETEVHESPSKRSKADWDQQPSQHSVNFRI